MTRVYLRGSARRSNVARGGESAVVPLRFADSAVWVQDRVGWWLGLGLVLTLVFAAAELAVASSRQANKFYNQGNKAELAKDYDKALEFDEQAVAEDTSAPLEREREEREHKLGRLKGLPQVALLASRKLEALTFRKQESKVIFETIGKLAGIHVLFDSEYDNSEISIELRSTTLYEALDYVSLLAKSNWKPLTDNAIFVTNDSTNKRRDYDDF